MIRSVKHSDPVCRIAVRGESAVRTGLPLLVASLLSACALEPRPLRFETRSSSESEHRRPPAVAIDPTPELPPKSSGGHADQRLLVLETPRDPRAARALVRQFFSAVQHNDIAEMERMIASDAWIVFGASGGRQRALSFWRTRLGKLDYTELADHVLYRESDIETYVAGDATHVRRARRLPGIQGDDVLIRVPVSSPRAGATRLFGDEIIFLLRPHQGRYSIVELTEDFRLP
jgi:hypothetical protein